MSESSGDAAERRLRSHLLEREMRDSRTLLCMLNGQSADITVGVEVQHRVLVEILRLGDLAGAELDIQRIGVLEIGDLHGTKSLSKKALWTVSRSSIRMTRRYFPSASSILAQRRIRPSAWIVSRSGASTASLIPLRPIAAPGG